MFWCRPMIPGLVAAHRPGYDLSSWWDDVCARWGEEDAVLFHCARTQYAGLERPRRWFLFAPRGEAGRRWIRRYAAEERSSRFEAKDG